MRESFGGAFMIKMVLCLVVIYITLMSIGLIYSRGFRVKNKVINILEQYQYAGEDNSKAEAAIESYLNDIKFSYSSEELVEVNNKCLAEGGSLLSGICVVDKTYPDSFGRYYKVIVYVPILSGIGNNLFGIVDPYLPISGETKTMQY